MGDDFFQGYDGGGSVAVGTGINDANAGFDWATLGQKASDLLAYGVKRKIDIASFRTLSQDQPDMFLMPNGQRVSATQYQQLANSQKSGLQLNMTTVLIFGLIAYLLVKN